MMLTNTEKKRIRKIFNKTLENFSIPNLLAIQLSSYKKFLYKDRKQKSGLDVAFKSIFPIYSYNNKAELHYVNYILGKKIFHSSECHVRGLTYSIPIKVILKLIIFKYVLNNNGVKEKQTIIRSQEVYICDIPLITKRGTFIINGTERVVVSQLHRSPGVFFDSDKGKIHSSGKILYSARIIPYRGSWLDFEFDIRDHIFMRIDRRRKLPVTVLLKALNYNKSDIIRLFYHVITISIIDKQVFLYLNKDDLLNISLPFNIIINNKIIIPKNCIIGLDQINKLLSYNNEYILLSNEDIINSFLATDINIIILDTNHTKKILLGTCIDRILLSNLLINNNINFKIFFLNKLNSYPYIWDTLNIDSTLNQEDALLEIYRVMRPGEPPTLEIATFLFKNLFFITDKYDLSIVGRMKLNRSLNRINLTGPTILLKKDIIDTLRKLINLKNGFGIVDDIDHLGHRRVRSVGELVENQFRIGLVRIEKNIREFLSIGNLDNIYPQDFINAKPLSLIIKDFFCTSQLSQFMDQTNPLSEITHKRRISALGPGGLTRERAGFEVRDVHPTHYGRLCPIETPEGPNIGLINSLSLYARVNNYGFLETPYRVVKEACVLNEIHYLSAIEEENYIIAQASTILNQDGYIVQKFIICRYKNEFLWCKSSLVNYIDISTQQIVSIGASLIPFLEHNDANRALMGVNMQRQAVPNILITKPLVGTGIERVVGCDSGITVISKYNGFIKYVDSTKIILEVPKKNSFNKVKIFYLLKYLRSNQNTCINQKPCVYLQEQINIGDILADGPATDLGELALGQNVRVAFMPWYGYNFEDSLLISEKLIHKDIFTTIHIQELFCISRDTKLGVEEITADIPNISESVLSKLDENGIVYVGAEVFGGDILVGKVTPKNESQLTPEEKLLRAIFGEKATEVKDTSLRVPNGCSGTVIDVQILHREGINKDARAKSIEELKLKNLYKKKKEKYKYILLNIYIFFIQILYKCHVTTEIIKHLTYKNFIFFDINKLRYKHILLKLIKKYQFIRNKLYLNKNYYLSKITCTNDLAPGILKIIKVYLAVKKSVQVGDKMAGRHGNKGVISKICPVEDMPYDEFGHSIDIVLNPLGVPSRMNLGQILETHLGLISKAIGNKIKQMLCINTSLEEIKKFLLPIYRRTSSQVLLEIKKFTTKEWYRLLNNLVQGLPIATPVFNGISEYEIKLLFRYLKIPSTGQMILYDGLTGEKFERPITVGYMYMMKLNHLVDDKMHARSTGAYSLVTQQPLGGKAQFGGQRFGEMEVWALEAYGAAYTLQEMLTVKSDDVVGRTKIYKNIINGDHKMEPNIPESFNVLLKEICALGINIDLTNNKL